MVLQGNASHGLQFSVFMFIISSFVYTSCRVQSKGIPSLRNALDRTQKYIYSSSGTRTRDLLFER